MFGITDPLTYLVGVIVIILLPGPNSMYVLSVAAQRGIRVGYQAACGVFLGDAVLLLLTALGAASLLKAYPSLFMLIKYSGAAYLAWLGLNMLRNAYGALRRGAEVVSVSAQELQNQKPFQKALVISLLNPKAILFLLSFFVQFIDPGYPHQALTFLLLSLTVQFFSFVYLSALIFVGTHLAQVFRRQRLLSAGLSGGVGAMFLGFGAKLAASSLS